MTPPALFFWTTFWGLHNITEHSFLLELMPWNHSHCFFLTFLKSALLKSSSLCLVFFNFILMNSEGRLLSSRMHSSLAHQSGSSLLDRISSTLSLPHLRRWLLWKAHCCIVWHSAFQLNESTYTCPNIWTFPSLLYLAFLLVLCPLLYKVLTKIIIWLKWGYRGKVQMGNRRIL